jgi:hypothetical protein
MVIVAREIWNNLGQELVITGGQEYSPNHITKSFHYSGFGLDFRTRYFEPHEKLSAFQQLTRNLGEEFDVVMHETHIHAEYDPK